MSAGLTAIIAEALREHSPRDGTPAGECECGWRYDGLGRHLRAHQAAQIAARLGIERCQYGDGEWTAHRGHPQFRVRALESQ